MNQKATYLLCASLLLGGCSGALVEETSQSGGSASTTTSMSTGGSAGGGAAGGAGSAGSTGTPTSSEQSVTIEMDSFDIAPGEEVYKCQNFANPFGGDAEIGMFESHMTPGSHHLLLFYAAGATSGALEDCSGLEFAPTPYSTQLPDDTLGFPDGVAAAIPSTSGLRLQSHYLNTTADKITAHVKMTFHLADPANVKDLAGVLFIVQPNINIQPNTTQDVTYDCQVPLDMKVLKTASHMHRHGTKFTSTVAGAVFYETDTWDEPKPALFDPPRELHAGDPLHFACTFVNNSPSVLHFGESASSDEMCILGASYYPAPPGQTTIGCQ